MDTLVPGRSGEIDWRHKPVSSLTGFIVERYHAAHRAQLPELIQLARRVEVAHAGKDGCPVGLADLLEAFNQELESHMTKEERVLFPMLVQGARSQARGPISVMRYEHRHHVEALAQIASLTGGLSAPSHACATWRRLCDGLRQFDEDLNRHLQLENDVLFSLDSEVAEGAQDA